MFLERSCRPHSRKSWGVPDRECLCHWRDAFLTQGEVPASDCTRKGLNGTGSKGGFRGWGSRFRWRQIGTCDACHGLALHSSRPKPGHKKDPLFYYPFKFMVLTKQNSSEHLIFLFCEATALRRCRSSCSQLSLLRSFCSCGYFWLKKKIAKRFFPPSKSSLSIVNLDYVPEIGMII